MAFHAGRLAAFVVLVGLAVAERGTDVVAAEKLESGLGDDFVYNDADKDGSQYGADTNSSLFEQQPVQTQDSKADDDDIKDNFEDATADAKVDFRSDVTDGKADEWNKEANDAKRKAMQCANGLGKLLWQEKASGLIPQAGLFHKSWEKVVEKAEKCKRAYSAAAVAWQMAYSAEVATNITSAEVKDAQAREGNLDAFILAANAVLKVDGLKNRSKSAAARNARVVWESGWNTAWEAPDYIKLAGEATQKAMQCADKLGVPTHNSLTYTPFVDWKKVVERAEKAKRAYSVAEQAWGDAAKVTSYGAMANFRFVNRIEETKRQKAGKPSAAFDEQKAGKMIQAASAESKEAQAESQDARARKSNLDIFILLAKAVIKVDDFEVRRKAEAEKKALAIWRAGGLSDWQALVLRF